MLYTSSNKNKTKTTTVSITTNHTTNETKTDVSVTESQNTDRKFSLSLQPVIDWLKVILGEIFGF